MTPASSTQSRIYHVRVSLLKLFVLDLLENCLMVLLIVNVSMIFGSFGNKYLCLELRIVVAFFLNFLNLLEAIVVRLFGF